MEGSTVSATEVVDYHDRPEISNSMLKVLIEEGPAVYRDRFVTRTECLGVSDAMDIGTVIHAVFLENKPWSEVCEFEPTGLKTRSGKAWDAFVDDVEWDGRFAFLSSMRPILESAVDALRRNPAVEDMLVGMTPEVAHFWRDTRSGLDLRCRFDAVDTDIVFDLKTTSKPIDEGSLAKQIENMGYYRQAAFYTKGFRHLNGREPLAFVFCFVQVCAPYETALVTLTKEWIDDGEAEVDDALSDLASRMATNTWTRATYGQVVRLERPRWAKYKHEYNA
jgi:hypothetical protein